MRYSKALHYPFHIFYDKPENDTLLWWHYEGVDRGVGLSPLPPPYLPPPAPWSPSSLLEQFFPPSFFSSPLPPPAPSSPSSLPLFSPLPPPLLPPPSPSSPPSRPLISHLPLTLSAPSIMKNLLKQKYSGILS